MPDEAGTHERAKPRIEGGCDHLHARTGSNRPGDPPQRDNSPTDDEDPPTGQVEGQRIAGRAHQMCSPHSTLF